jgi:dolichyl-phosphate-mannose-protein mannosyltransferase
MAPYGSPNQVSRRDLQARQLKGLLTSLLVLVAPALLLAFTPVRSGETTGPILALRHAAEFLCSALLMAASAGLGRFVLRRVGLQPAPPTCSLPFDVAVGAGIMATALLGIGATVGVSPVIVLGTVSVLGAIGYLDAKDLVGELIGWVRTRPRGTSVAKCFIVCWLSFVTLYLFAVALGPPVDYDSLMYHLRVPTQWLAQGRLFLPEDNLNTAFVGLIHMLYLPLLAVGAESGPAVLNVIFALLLALGVADLTKVLSGNHASLLAAVLLGGSCTLLLVAPTPKVDAPLALYLFLGHYAGIQATRHSDGRRWLVLAGVLLGFAFGVKYLAAPYGMSLAPIFLAWTLSCKRRMQCCAAFVVALAAAVILALPWLAKNWVLLGAPTYPFLTGRQLEPWLAALHGNRAVPEGLGRSIEVLRQVRQPLNLSDLLWHPGRLTPEGEGGLYFLNPAFVLVPLAVVQRRQLLLLLCLPTALYLLLLLGVSRETNLRYLVPMFAPLTVVAACVVSDIVSRWGRQLWVQTSVAMVVACVLLPSTLIAAYRLVQSDAIPYAVGATTIEDYRSGSPNSSLAHFYQMVATINDEVPSGRILFLFEGRGLPFQSTVLQDDVFTNWLLLSRLHLTQTCLSGTNITHVLVNRVVLDYLISRGLTYEAVDWPDFDAFARKCLTPVIVEPGYVLFAVLRPETLYQPPPRQEGYRSNHH